MSRAGAGELDRAAFEEIFPWRTGWASAVLTEGLLVPAGAGYRFAHEELGDWVQGAHLDLDRALRSLVHRWYEEVPGGGARVAEERVPAQRSPHPGRRASAASERGLVRGQERRADAASGATPSREPHTLPVPRHRIGPVIQALLLLGRRQGAAALSDRLADLIDAVDRPADLIEAFDLLSTRTDDPATAVRRQGTVIPTAAAGPDEGAARPGAAGDAGPLRDASWWAAHLLSQTLLRVPDAGPYVEVLRLLAGRIVRRSGVEGGTGGQEAPAMSRPARDIADATWGRTPSSDRGSGGGCGCPRRTGSTCCGGWCPRTARRAETGGTETATAGGAGPSRVVTRAGTAARSGSWMWWPGGSSPGPDRAAPALSLVHRRAPAARRGRCGDAADRRSRRAGSPPRPS